MSTPSTSFEIELTFDVDPDTALPDFLRIPGVSRVGEPENRQLDARYYDTPELALGRAGTALRRREGGPDAGWHIKGPKRGHGRTETAWPLSEGDAEGVPDTIRSALAPLAGEAPLTPLARIRNARTAFALYDDAGAVLVEFVDDRVTATDLRREVTNSWREWEAELGPAAPASEHERSALLSALRDVALAAGARPATVTSKLGKTLGAHDDDALG